MKTKLKATLECVIGSVMHFHIDNKQTLPARQLGEKCFIHQQRGGELLLTVEEWRNPRTLDQNAAMWALLADMAVVLDTDKDELYIEMLDRYGKFTHVIVKPEAAEAVKREWRTVRELGEVEVNGKKGIQLQCYFGSSTYDTKEMARLLDGVIYEARELGIDTMEV